MYWYTIPGTLEEKRMARKARITRSHALKSRTLVPVYKPSHENLMNKRGPQESYRNAGETESPSTTPRNGSQTRQTRNRAAPPPLPPPPFRFPPLPASERRHRRRRRARARADGARGRALSLSLSARPPQPVYPSPPVFFEVKGSSYDRGR